MPAAELLFALQIRRLAADLRSTAKATYYTSIYQKIDKIDHEANLAQWDSEHPMESFLDQAVDEVERVAAYLAKRNVIKAP